MKLKTTCNQCKNCAVENTAVLGCADSHCRCHSMRVKIGVPIDQYNLHWETHSIESIEENPHNEIVPFSFTTCCGKYIPTSGADGHFEHSVRLGGWELIK